MIMRSSNKTSTFILTLLLVLTCALNAASALAQSVPSIPTIWSTTTNGVVTIHWSVPPESVTRYTLAEDIDARIYEFPVGVNSFRPTITGSNIWYSIRACNGPSNSDCSRYSSFYPVNIPPSSSSISSSSIKSSSLSSNASSRSSSSSSRSSSSSSRSSSSSKSSFSSASSVQAPAQPTFNVTTDVYTKTFLLVWSNVGAASYELQYKGASSKEDLPTANWNAVSKDSTLSKTIAMQTVQSYSHLQWRIRACSATNLCSGWQESRIKTNQADTLSAGPSLVSPATGVILENSQQAPCFEWQADAAATQYFVTISDTTEFTEKRWTKKVGNATSTCWALGEGWIKEGIYNGELPASISHSQLYYWRVGLIDANGKYGFSHYRSFTLSSIPGTPQLHATPSEDKQRVTLSWERPIGEITQYYLEEDNVNETGARWVEVYWVAPDATSYQTTTQGVSKYKIKACKAQSCSAFSNMVSTHIQAPPAAPQSFSTIRKTNEGAFGLSWALVSNAVSYELEYVRATTAADAKASLAWVSLESVSTTSFQHTDLDSGKYYKWRVRACKQSGACSPFVESKVKVVEPIPTLISPALVYPVNSALISNSNPLYPCFYWAPNPETGAREVTKYKVAISPVQEFSDRQWIIEVPASQQMICWSGGSSWGKNGVYIDELPSQLQLNQAYYWRVSAFNQAGEVGFSNARTFTYSSSANASDGIPAIQRTTQIGVPVVKGVSSNNGKKIHLNWNLPSGSVSYYQVEASYPLEKTYYVMSTSFELPEVYSVTYTVRACNDASVCSNDSAPLQITNTMHEAENPHTSSGMAVKNVLAGYSGTGYAELNVDGFIEWRVHRLDVEDAVLIFYYNNSSQVAKSAEIRSNGIIIGNVVLPPSSGWSSVAIRTTLIGNHNYIRMVPSSSTEGLSIDKLNVQTVLEGSPGEGTGFSSSSRSDQSSSFRSDQSSSSNEVSSGISYSSSSINAVVAIPSAGLTNGVVNDLPPADAPVEQVVGTVAGQFRVSESGAATYSVPLIVPQGVAGVAPKLSFDYSSMAGNGLLGQGWSLSGLSAITRCRQTLIHDNQSLPISWSNSDRFCLDGQRLMLVSGSYAAPGSTYRTEIDSGALITAEGGTEGHPEYFKVEAKDGSLSFFGFTSDSKLNGSVANTTLTWAINRFQDNVGNGIDYVYSNTAGNGQYIEEIRYAFPTTNNETPSSSRTDFNAKVRFEYINRDDKVEAYVAGQKFVQAKKLVTVNVYNADSQGGGGLTLFRNYRLMYMGSTTTDGRYENSLTRLTQIYECMTTDDITSAPCLMPLSFSWGGGSHITFDKTMTSLDFPTIENDRYLLSHQFADVNGDGKQDLIYLTLERFVDETQADVNINIAYADSNTIGLIPQSTIKLYRKSYEKLRISSLDYNADGRQDLAIFMGDFWRIYLSSVDADGNWYLDSVSVVALTNLTSEDVLFFDMNGDGLVDAVTSAGYQLLQRNNNTNSSNNAYSFASQSGSFQWQARSEFPQLNEPLPSTMTSLVNCQEISPETKIQQESGADFNGDGVMDFLGTYVRKLMCDSSAGPTVVDAVYRYALVNRNGTLQNYSGTALQMPSLLPGGSSDMLFTIDVNGDGLTDIVSLGFDKKLKFRTNNGAGFNPEQIWVELSGLANGESPQFIDYNNDGHMDVLWRNINQGQMMVKYGGLSKDAFSIFTTTASDKESYLVMDVSGDGTVDYMRVTKDGLTGRLGEMAEKDEPICEIIQRPIEHGGPFSHCSDPSYALMENQQHTFIYKIENGFGNTTQIAYGSLSNSGRYDSMDVDPDVITGTDTRLCPIANPGNCTVDYPYTKVDSSGFYSRLNGGWELPAGHRVWDVSSGTMKLASDMTTKGNPVLEVHGAMQVVTMVKSSAPLPSDPNAMSQVDYYYGEAKMQALGRGFLGFHRLKTVDTQSGITTVTTYRQDFPFAGSPLSTAVYKNNTSDAPLLSFAANQWDTRVLGDTGARYYQPYLRQAKEFTYVMDSDGSVTTTPLQTVTTNTVMYPDDTSDTANSYGNVQAVTVTTEGGGKVLTKTTTNEYFTDVWALRMGRLKGSEVETSIDGNTAERSVAFKYYGVNGEDVTGGAEGLLKEEKVIVADADDQLVTVYTYDTYGNKHTVSTTGKSGESETSTQTRVTTNNYDEQGRYLLSSENGLDHSSSVGNYNKFGQPQTITDSNNISTEVKYDVFGNEYQRYEKLANNSKGAWTHKETHFCDSSTNCPANAKFFTHQQVSGGGEAKEYFDMLGRVTRSSKKGFDGTWIYVDTEYDNLGRVKRHSLPYFAGAAPASRLWSENFYDALGRVTRVSAPDESGTINTYSSYSVDATTGGLRTTLTNPKNKTRQEVRNGLGQLIYVEDQLGGSISYEYSPLGEILSVSTGAADADDSTIKMCYDTLGRKTGMFDPDKGGFSGTADVGCNQINNWNGGSSNTTAGWWHYRYNAFGEVIEQRDPKGQSTFMKYDLLGRLVNRLDYTATATVEANSAWFYDAPLGTPASERLSAEHVKTRGKLIATIMSETSAEITNAATSCGGSNHCSTYTYNNRAQVNSSTTHLPNGDVFVTQSDYDSIGRLYQVRDVLDQVGGVLGFESGIQTQFNSSGYPYRTVDIASWDGTNGVLSTVEEMNERGQVTKELRGNGLRTVNTFFEKSGLLESQRVMDALNVSVIQSNDYTWDSLGNLASRTNKSARVLQEGQSVQYNNRKEYFCYDALNRLVKTHPTASHVCSGESSADDDMAYDGFGNITKKTGVGEYEYNRTDGGPHAVTKAGNASYTYDANGNLEYETIEQEAGSNSGLGKRTFTYTSYDMVKSIAREDSDQSVEFKYGPDRARWQRTDYNGSIIKTTTYLGNVERIETTGSEEIEWKRYVGGVVITYKTSTNAEQQNLQVFKADKSFLYKDHLGSTDIITNTLGAPTHSMSFDPWGARREADSNGVLAWGEAAAKDDLTILNEILASQKLTGFANPITTRGYTGHEMVDEMGIIHMNGRIYDPKLARFLQADPFIQAATNTQSYNRYSYVMNNPLNTTDPSGFFFKKLAKKFGMTGSVHLLATGDFIGAKSMHYVHKLTASNQTTAQIYVGVVSAVSAYFCGPCSIGFSAMASADMAYYQSGSVSIALRQGAIAGASAAVFYGISQVGIESTVGRVAAYGTAGGVMSVLQGGEFGHGFVSAGVGQLGIGGGDYSAGNMIATTLVAGTVSELTGGKFANGAVTAAMAYAAQWGADKISTGGTTPANKPENSGGTTSCNPINIATGEKYLTMVDYQAEGASQLKFERHYSSYATEKSSLGIGWRSNFDRKLEVNNVGDVALRVVAVRHQGDAIVFNWVDDESIAGGRWVTDNSRYETIHKTDTGWELVLNDNSREVYDAEGRLIAIKQLDGYEQTLVYGNQGTVKNVLLSVSDSAGQQLQFAYDLQARMTSMTATDGSVTRYEYDQYHNLNKVISPDDTADEFDNAFVVYDYNNASFIHAITGIRNSHGQRIHSMDYDEKGRAILSALGGNAERVDMVFSASENNTHKTLVKNSLGKHTTYTFDQHNKPLLVEGHPTASCIGSNQGYDYNEKGLLRSKTDWNGSVTSYEYNDRGLETLRTEAVGTASERSTSTEWHKQWRLPETIAKEGLVVIFKYNDQAQVTQRIERDTTAELTFVNKLFKRYPERIWNYGYNAQGLLKTVDGPRTDVADITHFEYDTAGNQKAVINALGHRSEVLAVNERGLPIRVSDANGVVTELVYNTRGWLTSKTIKSEEGDSTTTYHYSGISDYNNQGLVSAVTLPNGEEIHYEYDAARRLTAQYNKAGERIEYVLDLEGNRTEQHIFNSTGILAFSHKQVFDELGRLLSSIGGDGNAIGFGYDKAGNRETTTDARGNTTRYAYDALNRLQATTDALDGVVAQTYDAADRITSITDQRKLTTQYRYNGFGNKIAQLSPDTGETIYGYDQVGNIVSKRDARGVITEYRYDAISRVTDIIYPAANESNIRYAYDDQQNAHAIGRISKVNDASGEQTYRYNAFGQVTQLQSSIKGTRYTQVYDYDRSNQLVMQQYPSGRRVNYHYDAQGRLASVDTAYNKQKQNLLTQIKHYPFGPLATLGYGNGTQLNVGVDQDYRIRTQQVMNAANNAVYDRAYGYDKGSNIVGIIDYTKPSANQVFGYDELSRLTNASGSYGVISYQYDAVGNRKSREQNNRLEAYEYAQDSNRLLSVISEGEQGELQTRALGYDAVGNIVSDSANTAAKALTFGHSNRLEQVKVNGNATTVAGYEYNAKGQRVIKHVDGKVIHFHYDTDNRLLAETTETGMPIREYIYAANQRIAMVDYQRNNAGDIYFIINDHLGTPQRLLDAQQQVVWSVDQSPFGEVTVEGNIEQPLRFPGQYADTETGYSYNYFRDYDPTLGRYIESDPIGLEAGVNTFGYVSGNPIMSFDLFGLIGEMCTTHDHLSYNTSNGEGWYDTKSGNTYGASPNWGMDDGIESVSPESYFIGGGAILKGGAALFSRALTTEVTVARWGRAGLESGDWVMKGGKSPWNYFWSGKWQPGMGNQFARYGSAETFVVPRSSLQWPKGGGVDGWYKGLFGQRKYVP